MDESAILTETNDTTHGTILVVDDVPANLDILFKYLKKAGFRVLVARDGQGALRQAQYAQPDIILLDVMMPQMDGFETCRHLKQNEITQDVPVIFMTALTDIESKVRGFEAGAVDYVTKPVEYQEVLARITTHLTLRNLQKSLEEEIAERKKAEIELQARNEELDAFAYTVAHNLKNPLGVIMGVVEVFELAGLESNPKIDRLLVALQQSAQKANSIIEALLLLARVRKEEIIQVPLRMNPIIDTVQQRLAPMIEESQAEIITPPDWPLALGYPAWIEEVWINYMSNAIKYGGQPPRLELGATEETGNTTVRFWIKDNGPGLTPQEQKKLFVPFNRLNKTHSQQGHGLGLSIVHRIVTKLGGEVGVANNPDQGSVFSFSLPTVITD